MKERERKEQGQPALVCASELSRVPRGTQWEPSRQASLLLSQLQVPFEDGVRRYRQRSPAMALGVADHLWSFQELLISRTPTTS